MAESVICIMDVPGSADGMKRRSELSVSAGDLYKLLSLELTRSSEVPTCISPLVSESSVLASFSQIVPVSIPAVIAAVDWKNTVGFENLERSMRDRC